MLPKDARRGHCVDSININGARVPGETQDGDGTNCPMRSERPATEMLHGHL